MNKMDLIFENGEILYLKQNPALLMKKILDVNLCAYQKTIINNIVGNEFIHSDKIYGDDFLVEVGQHQNYNGDLTISIKDFDEHQKEEAQISISFTKKELGQLIGLLQDRYNNL
jgi:hypothetical protein